MRPPMKHVAQSLSTLFSTYASHAASMMLLCSMASEVFPRELRQYIVAMSRYLFLKFRSGSKKLTLVIESVLTSKQVNPVYESSLIYLATRINPFAERLKLTKNPDAKNFGLTFDGREEIEDSFEGVKLVWHFVVEEIVSERRSRNYKEKRYLELTFDKKNQEKVLNNYLPHVLGTANSMKQGDKRVKLFHKDCKDPNWDGVSPKGRGCIDLDHPATFDTLAMDPDLKNTLLVFLVY